jgi:hypothetical protein
LRYQFIKGWSTQCAVRINKEAHKTDFEEAGGATIGVQNVAEGVFIESRILRRIASKLYENGNGNTPQIRKNEYIS